MRSLAAAWASCASLQFNAAGQVELMLKTQFQRRLTKMMLDPRPRA